MNLSIMKSKKTEEESEQSSLPAKSFPAKALPAKALPAKAFPAKALAPPCSIWKFIPQVFDQSTL